MRKSQFTDEKMVKILRDAEKTSVAAAAKRHGVSTTTASTLPACAHLARGAKKNRRVEAKE